jgi:hypothetical protein
MATLNLTASEFSDIAMIWLFDQIMNPEQVQNENLKEFIDKQGTKIKSPLIKYYLDTDGKPRIRYRRIKGIFDGSDKSVQQIRIGPDEEIQQIRKKKDGIVKEILKKIVAKEQLTLEDEQFFNENRELFDEIKIEKEILWEN